MPILAYIDGMKLYVYGNDHSYPHFHVPFAEYRLKVGIETLEVTEGAPPRPKLARAIEWARPRQEQLLEAWAQARSGSPVRKNSMNVLPRITHAEPVIHGVMKLIFTGGYEGVDDLRPVIPCGRIWAFLQNPDNFGKVQIEEYGHHIFWIDEAIRREIDLAADGLPRDCERQAEVHMLMAS